MALLNEESIRTLASFKTPDRPVVTAYLDVDGKRWPKYADVEARFDRLVRDNGEALSNGHATAVDDLQKIQGHLRAGIDRSRTRGLAIFSCGDALWEVHQLPVRVKDQLVVNQTPHVRQLEGILDNYKGFGLLLAGQAAHPHVRVRAERARRQERGLRGPAHGTPTTPATATAGTSEATSGRPPPTST